jgi:hypothetical protein
MIRSMTGYGRAEVAGTRLSLTVECKSLNHRHLDIVVKLPRAFSALELDARRVIQGAVQRGRVEVGVSAAPVEGTPAIGLSVDMAQARAYVAMARRVGDDLKLGDRLDLQWVLERPGVLSRDDQEAPSPEDGWPLLHDALTKSLGELCVGVKRRARRSAGASPSPPPWKHVAAWWAGPRRPERKGSGSGAGAGAPGPSRSTKGGSPRVAMGGEGRHSESWRGCTAPGEFARLSTRAGRWDVPSTLIRS